MQKPNGYDEAREQGSFTPIELGGHYAVIKQVSETQSKSGQNMVVVLFDFTAPDKQAGYHQMAFNGDDRDQKKWPFNGTKWIMTQDWNDPSKTNRAFKTFCSCYEKSNNCSITWGGANWAAQFKGKRIGIVYGEEEQEYDGRISMRHVPKWFCSWDAVEGASIPKPKYLNGNGPSVPAAQASKEIDGFLSIPDGTEEEIPF